MGKGILGIIGGTAFNEIMAAGKANKQREAEENRMYLGMLMNQMNAHYNQKLTKELWDYTNYENQRKHLEAAGLNPALLYGQGGGGGATTAGAGAAGTPFLEPKGEALGLQAKLVNSQVMLNMASAKKINEEAKNVEQDTNLKISQVDLNNMTKNKTKEEINLLVNQTKSAFEEFKSKAMSNEITEATKQTVIEKATKELELLKNQVATEGKQKELLQKEIDNFEKSLNNETITAEALASQALTAINKLELEVEKWEKEKDWQDTKILQGWVIGIGSISTDLLKTIVLAKKGGKFYKEFKEILKKIGK